MPYRENEFEEHDCGRALLEKLFCIVMLGLLMACSSEKPAGVGVPGQGAPEGAGTAGTAPLKASGPAPGGISLEITPSEAMRNSTLYLNPKGFNPGDARIEWLVNGKPTEVSDVRQFRLSSLGKGDKVQARAVLQGNEVLSDIVQIRNTPPEVMSVRILPPEAKPGDTLSIEAKAEDADGDTVTFTYEWRKNEESAGDGSQAKIELKRGDRISVKITPFDGTAYGQSKMITRDIRNVPPVITEDRKFKFDGKVWSYQVKASDTDGDTLAYSLKAGPQGMTIGGTTGLVTWEVPPQFAGKAPATVSVSDGHGGEATYNFEVTIEAERKKK